MKPYTYGVCVKIPCTHERRRADVKKFLLFVSEFSVNYDITCSPVDDTDVVTITFESHRLYMLLEPFFRCYADTFGKNEVHNDKARGLD